MKWYALLVVCVVLSACAPKVVPPEPLAQKASLAVAGFSQPVHGWDFLSGGMPDPGNTVDKGVLPVLDRLLHEAVQTKRQNFQGVKLVRNCQEILLAQQDRLDHSAYEYWQKVGNCLAVDYLLIPFIFSWQEREGGEWGVDVPAHVAFDLNLMEISSGKVKCFHFDEKQESLTENMFKIGRFFRRGGRWLSAEDLALEGMRLGVEDLGL